MKFGNIKDWYRGYNMLQCSGNLVVFSVSYQYEDGIVICLSYLTAPLKL